MVGIEILGIHNESPYADSLKGGCECIEAAKETVYIAVFRHFIGPGVWEGVYEIEALMKVGLSVEGDTVTRTLGARAPSCSRSPCSTG